jgi:tetrahydromethanopterin S-methyltransferase subunit B
MKLANRSELMGESTTMGQRISMLAERSPESSVVAMKKVRNERIKQLEKRVESLEGQLKNSKKSIKRTLKREQPKKSDWEAFVDEIKC